jgi:GABA(A) receptor-associated protein
MFFKQKERRLPFKSPLANMSLSERLSYSKKLTENYPDCVPILLSKRQDDKILQDIDKNKYLIPKNLNLTDFLCIIRRKINLTEHQAIFVFIVVFNATSNSSFLIPYNLTFGELYSQHMSDDNFLYMVYTTENTFG